MKKLKKFYLRFETFINYSLLGMGTAVINIVVYYIFTNFLNPRYDLLIFEWWEISNIAAWFVSNIYSFFVNRKYVFTKGDGKKRPLSMQIILFFSLRVVSLFLSMQVMAIMIEHFSLSHHLAKLVGMELEIILNYFICKLFIFKPKKQ